MPIKKGKIFVLIIGFVILIQGFNFVIDANNNTFNHDKINNIDIRNEVEIENKDLSTAGYWELNFIHISKKNLK